MKDTDKLHDSAPYSELYDTDTGYEVMTWASEADYDADPDGAYAIGRRHACVACVVHMTSADAADIPTGNNIAFWHDEHGRSDGTPSRVCDECLAASSPTGPGYRATCKPVWSDDEPAAPRSCHGCGRPIGQHQPERVVYCGRCGSDDDE